MQLANLSHQIIEEMAYEIKRFLLDHEAWFDVSIYFNGKRLSTRIGLDAYNHPEISLLEENINPKDYFANTGHILCMSFEGTLYHILHYGDTREDALIRNGLYQIFKNYGCYHTYGDPWNLALYRKE